MVTDLLATKLLIPPPMRQAVPRTRLGEVLDRGVPAARLTLISTPPGYGKTTLLAQWVRSSTLPVAWLTLGPGDNDPDRFFRYLLNAWETVRPGIRETPAGLLLGGISPPIDDVLMAIAQTAMDSPEHTVFGLDDAHLITEPAIHDALDFLLDNAPPTLHFVLAGREDPPLTLARYRARQELLELRGEDLQFGPGEAREFLNDRMGLDLGESEAGSLNAQLEGWVTGLQLVALTLRHRPVSGEPLRVSGRHRHVADYLGEEVFAHLSEATRTFLLHTSILDRLGDSLCHAVTGNQQSQAMLEELERANLFLMPLDDSRTWFRYHRLFAEFLRHNLLQLYPEEVNNLHSRAATWYLAHDLPEQAFQHAMAGRDPELVTEVVDRYSTVKLFSGEMRAVREWLDALPNDWIATIPKLGLAEAGYLVLTGQTDASIRRLDQIEQRARATDAGTDVNGSLARVTATRCFVACFANDLSRAITYANEALRDLPEEDAGYRADIYHALGDTYRGHGRWTEARGCYRRVLDYAHDVAFPVRAGHVYGALADLELRQGHLGKAAGYWTRALEKIEDRELWGRFPLPVAGWAYLRMGELFYERNELEEARQYISRGLERAGLGGDARAMIVGHVVAGRMELTDGDIESAAAHLAQAHILLETASFPEWAGRLARCQVDLWIAQNNVTAAIGWLSDLELDGPGVGSQPVSEDPQLAVSRVLVHTGDPKALARAEDILGQLIAKADELGQLGVAIEALALRSLAHEQRHNRIAALTNLERALRLAEPEGYVRLFADLGLPMVRLLQDARSRGVMSAYVSRLLAAFGDTTGGESSLVEPLSPREHDVLMLMAAGLSNREIADSLYVSPETIKKHTGNIYGKLGVRGRIEAVTKAKSLALID